MIQLDHPVKTEAATWAAVALARDDVAAADRGSSFWTEGWRRCADRGIQGMTVDRVHGGQGRDRVDALLTFEGLGYGSQDQGLVFGVACQTWAVLAALDAGASDAQRHELLPGLCSGELIGAFAMTELDSGSDTFALACAAERTADGYRLSGRKAYVTLAPVADVVIVFATVDPGLGRWGITAFLVDTSLPGVDIDHPREKMGLRTTPFGDVVLTDVDVPESARLGPEGSGGAIFNAAMESERAYLFALQLGQLERQLDDTIAHARSRRQFDRAIGDFQAVSHRIADMKARHEQARLLLYKTALLDELGRASSLTAALTKLAATEGAVASGLDAVMTMGARGYLTETGLERELRGAIGGMIYSGTSDIQRNIVAKLMGVGE
ncbi:MAG: acyl-CoA dehydrogenase family protein [Acidimicrobiia bacterium]|nr:acyl-CoA dehydrogenase family protein [Acidimicrobiia bacterium]